ncbi:MAG: helix-turn-helix domain-containing protein [Planctomycetes bacterium]|nr:helix-turn-helix domain-containing protein [Planctomycetota bacterium]
MDRQDLFRELGRKLRSAREGAGMSVTELARQSGLSRRHVTEAEAGRANLSVGKLFDLSVALGVPLRRLFDLEPAKPARVALVGLRGAGKSSLGRALALALEVPFVELDARVEELAGLSLAAIFELHGSSGFRRFEAEALEKVLSEGERCVLATGGSIVHSPETYARLRSTCHTVWLKATPEDHYARVVAQGDLRPMSGRPRAIEELRALLETREPLYAQCEHTVFTSGSTPARIVADLATRFADA